MTIQVGDKLPSATLIKAAESGPDAVQTDEFFAGRKVALFSVPAARRVTCPGSSTRSTS
jgi:glutaredoxin/glutathione-dependent peroxiredoxin